jgi:hypothetical protein
MTVCHPELVSGSHFLSNLLFKENFNLNQHISDFESFEKLFNAILDDAVIKNKMITILGMAPYPRHIVLSNWLEQLRQKNAPKNLTHTLTFLFDDNIAERIYRLVNKSNKKNHFKR